MIVDPNCNPLPNVMTPEQQAPKYQTMGIRGVTETVITGWVKQSAPNCLQPGLGRPYDIESWNAMANLQRTYGWTFVGGSRTYPDLTTLSQTDARAEICGSLTDIQSHGLTGGQGEFAYPNDRTNATLESIALGCGYDFGRLYTASASLEMPLPIPKPYWMDTMSVNGGACNDPAAACYQVPTRYHYTDPAIVAQRLASDPGHWKVVQGYNLVTGFTSSSTLSWDCTSPDWREHWTSGGLASEAYCWSDWITAISSPAAHLVWVTPAQMAVHRA
jgi:hypothetical protein